MDDELRRLRQDDAELRSEFQTAHSKIKRLKFEQDRRLLDRQVRELLQHADAESEAAIALAHAVAQYAVSSAPALTDAQQEKDKANVEEMPNKAFTEAGSAPILSSRAAPSTDKGSVTTKSSPQFDLSQSSSKALTLVPEEVAIDDNSSEMQGIENATPETGGTQQQGTTSKPENKAASSSNAYSTHSSTIRSILSLTRWPRKVQARKSTGGRPPLKVQARKSTGGRPPLRRDCRALFLLDLVNYTIKVKANPRAIRLPEETVYDYLRHFEDPVYPVPAAEELTGHTTTREFLSKAFGGNKNAFVQRLNPSHKAKHGYSHFLCPNLNTNPYAPQVPGAHGLIFRSENDYGVLAKDSKRNRKPHKVISGLGPNMWLYTGDYELQESGSLTPEQWGALPQKAREKWAMSIVKAKAGPRAQARASIALRLQYKCEPSTSQVKKMIKRKGDAWDNVKLEDVEGALQRGEERIDVLVMKCVGYDVAFQQKLVNGPEFGGDFVDSSDAQNSDSSDGDSSDGDSVSDEDVKQHSADSQTSKRPHSDSSDEEETQPPLKRIGL